MEIAGGCPSKYTRCTALVPRAPVGLSAVMVNSSGAVPSEDAGRGSANE